MGQIYCNRGWYFAKRNAGGFTRQAVTFTLSGIRYNLTLEFIKATPLSLARHFLQRRNLLYKRSLWFGDRCCFPVCMLIEVKRCVQQPADAQCAPLRRGLIYIGRLYKNIIMFCNTDSLPLDVISTKWSEAERAEKSPRRVNRGFLTGRFFGYSLSRIRLTPTARNDMLR